MATDPSSITPAGSAAEGGPLAEVPTWLRPVAPVVVMHAIMWVVEVIDIPLRGRLDRLGAPAMVGLPRHRLRPVPPRRFGYLIANTLLSSRARRCRRLRRTAPFILVTAIVMAGSGLGMWLFGTSNSVQIGASGLVFGYLTYLLTRGFIAQKLSWILGALVIGLFYGSLLWGLIPRHGVSFSGHLFGAISGVAAAWILHRSGADPVDDLP
jgi:hypothetical protein